MRERERRKRKCTGEREKSGLRCDCAISSRINVPKRRQREGEILGIWMEGENGSSLGVRPSRSGCPRSASTSPFLSPDVTKEDSWSWAFRNEGKIIKAMAPSSSDVTLFVIPKKAAAPLSVCRSQPPAIRLSINRCPMTLSLSLSLSLSVNFFPLHLRRRQAGIFLSRRHSPQFNPEKIETRFFLEKGGKAQPGIIIIELFYDFAPSRLSRAQPPFSCFADMIKEKFSSFCGRFLMCGEDTRDRKNTVVV